MHVVYHAPWNLNRNMLRAMDRCIKSVGILENIEEGDLVAIKVHVGEHGAPNYIRPMYVRHIAEMVRNVGGKPFITDTTTYYRVKRHNGYDAMITAARHGFIWSDIPFIVADGLKGENIIKLEGRGFLGEVEVAGAIYEADAIIAVSHCKGHLAAGYGGAIKNLGMGCVSKRSKLEQHRKIGIKVNTDKCTLCGTCIKVCPFDAIHMAGKRVVIDLERCMRCFICGEHCPQKAISLYNRENICLGLASAAHAVLSTFEDHKMAFVNIAVDISQGCDCVSTPGNFVSNNLGIYVSRSPVSADAAILKIIGRTLKEVNGVDPWWQVHEALRLGLKGTNEPEIEKI